MKNLMFCRRTFICTFAMLILAGLGVYKGTDVAPAIAMIAMALSGANAYEKASLKNAQYKND